MTNKQTYYFAAKFWDGRDRNGIRTRMTGLNKREAQRLYRLASRGQLQGWSDGGGQTSQRPYAWSWGVEEDGMRRVSEAGIADVEPAWIGEPE